LAEFVIEGLGLCFIYGVCGRNEMVVCGGAVGGECDWYVIGCCGKVGGGGWMEVVGCGCLFGV